MVRHRVFCADDMIAVGLQPATYFADYALQDVRVGDRTHGHHESNQK